mgnify:CR=1 FL=1
MELISLDQIAAGIPDGSKVAVAKDYTGVSVAATVALIQRKARNLHLVCLPIAGLQADMLIAAGCLSTVETSAVTMDEYGSSPSFLKAVREGSIKLLDGTCPAIHAGMQASQKGLPFMPIRGVIGSDLLRNRTDWAVIDNPFADGDPIVAIKAIDPDVALIHATAADRFGNVFFGRERDCLTLAHAAKKTYVTVESIVEGNLLDDTDKGGSVLPALYIEGIALVPQAAWPIGFGDHYPGDAQAMRAYLQAMRNGESAAAVLEQMVAAAPWTDALSSKVIAGSEDVPA